MCSEKATGQFSGIDSGWNDTNSIGTMAPPSVLFLRNSEKSPIKHP